MSLQHLWTLFCLISHMAAAKYVMYLTGQHDVVPELSLVSEINHVALAFMRSETFNIEKPTSWPLFTTVEAVRPKFSPGTAIMVAVGGWGDTRGFSIAAATEESRKRFARNIKAMIDITGADGVDIDWEYPGGNGEDYKQIPNSEKAWEVDAYPKLLSEIRTAIGREKLISAAVPGLVRDMIAFTNATLPKINQSLDFFNVMTYDLMNRRDSLTKHHTGVELSIAGVDEYLKAGVPPEKINLGFALYVKWFKTQHEPCSKGPIGCPTVEMEDPKTGADLGQAGAFAWIDNVPPELASSFAKAQASGTYDNSGGGYYYWDRDESIWWSWDTPEAILLKFPKIVKKLYLGGIFAWGLGEDSRDWSHLNAMTEGYRSLRELPNSSYETREKPVTHSSRHKQEL